MQGDALDGLRVLDLSILFAAPQIAAMLGDLGADVVKVETPAGDPLRAMGLTRRGQSLMWSYVGRNKRSVVVDPDDDAGRALLHRLCAAADVVVENLPPATLARWRCRPAEIARLNPRAIVVTVSCFGATGPYRDRPGAGTLAEAFGGLTHLTGDPDGPPQLASAPVGDVVTAMAGVIGALAACYHRDARDGSGQHVDVSMYEPVLALLGPSVVAHDDEHEPPGRTGSRVPGGVPRNVYATGDGHWIAVSGTTDAQVARLLPLLGRDDELDRVRFGSSTARLAAADELDAIVAEWIGARGRDEVLSALLDARVPAAPVNDLRSLLDDPHVATRAGASRRCPTVRSATCGCPRRSHGSARPRVASARPGRPSASTRTRCSPTGWARTADRYRSGRACEPETGRRWRLCRPPPTKAEGELASPKQGGGGGSADRRRRKLRGLRARRGVPEGSAAPLVRSRDLARVRLRAHESADRRGAGSATRQRALGRSGGGAHHAVTGER